MNKTPALTRQQGWSLIELGVAMAITGLISVMLWQSIPSPKVWESMSARHDDDLVRAQNALLGHLHAHHRLPYADVAENSTGYETSSNTSGRLPVRNLGLPSTIRLDYSVDGALAEPARIHYETPPLPIFPFEDPSSGITIPDTNFRNINWLSIDAARPISGLDTCSALVTAQRQPSLTSAGIPTAFSLKKRLAAPTLDKSQTHIPDYRVAIEADSLIMGVGEISHILRCPYYVGVAAGEILKARAWADVASLLTEQRRYRIYAENASRAALHAEKVDLGIISAWLLTFSIDLIFQLYKLNDLRANPSQTDRAVKLTLQIGNVLANLNLIARAILIIEKIAKNLPEKQQGLRTSETQTTYVTVRAHQAWELALSSRNDAVERLRRGLLP